jgi:uncharacterized protein
MAHPVTWFQISGKNGKQLHTFYKKAFGWRMQPAPGPGEMLMVEKEEDGISGGVSTSMDGLSSVTVYVNVANVAAHMKKIEAAGGKSAMPPMELPGGMGWIAGFHDPAGNWVGLWAPGKGAQPPVEKATARRAKAKAKAKPKTKAKAKPRPKAAPKPRAKAKPAKAATLGRKSAKKASPTRTSGKKSRTRWA